MDATCPHCNVNTADHPDAIRFYSDGRRECVRCGWIWQAHISLPPVDPTVVDEEVRFEVQDG